MIGKIGHYSLTNPASVYDEEALTALELAGRTAHKVNECVDAFNTLDKNVNVHIEKHEKAIDDRLDKHETEVDKRLDEQDNSLPEKITQQVDKYVRDGIFDEAIDEYMGELEDRLDNLVENTPSGSTTMDVEVIDIRLDADGKTHGSAGDAVREQVRGLADGTSKPNLINPRRLTPGFILTTGELYNSHQTGTFERWEYTSELIPVTPGLPYTFSYKHNDTIALWYGISTYDVDGNFIARPYVYEANTSDYARTFTFPETVVYVRVSYRSYMTGRVKFEQSSYATQKVEKTPSNNILDDYPLQFNGYIVANGSIFPQTEAGYIEGQPEQKEMYTCFIPVTPGEYYTLYHLASDYGWCALGIYSADGKAIERTVISSRKNEFIIPDGATAIMITARTLYLEDLALFKYAKPMTAEQRTYETRLSLYAQPEDAVNNPNVKAINHRGLNTTAPENTLSAFKLSAKQGYRYVECDVQATRDGVPVLLHDMTIDRTSNGTGQIADLTLAQVRAFDFGSWKNDIYAGEKIPTYEEFIALCKSLGLHAYVEIKVYNEELIKKIIAITRMYGMRDNVTFISFVTNTLLYVRRLDAKCRIGFVAESNDSSVIDVCEAIGGDVFVDLAASVVNDNIVSLCAENDIPLEVWTVNNEGSILNMNPYISGVTSDNLIAGQVLAGNTIAGVMTPAPQTLPTGKAIYYTVKESES